MRLLLRTVERLVARLKNDPAYRLCPDYSTRELAWISLYRGMQVARGIPLRLRMKQARGLVFRGRHVVVEHAYNLCSGPSLILEDNVHINALSSEGVTFGRNVTIAKAAVLVCTGVIANKGVGIRIGDYSAVGAQSFLGGQGGIQIGSNVIMGAGVRIFSENHNYEGPDVPIRKQGERRDRVIVEDNCWVGAGATILAGARIGTGSIVAACAVVTRDVPPYSVVAGVPARVIKSRSAKSRLEEQ